MNSLGRPSPRTGRDVGATNVIRMAKTNFTSVDAYLAAQPESARGVLEQVRVAIRKALPDAEETISYQIPAYKVGGAAVLYFAGWQRHFSVYPAKERLQEEFKTELAPYEINKSTIQIPLTEPVPVTLIERIAKFRVRELADERAAKSGGSNPG
jgi:uncharacterized protein YdhG (YjbR/CyaY superfamily)